MSLVILENVGLEFGGRALFSGLGLRVGEEDRIGIVGRNGSGKSSLLRLVAHVMRARYKDKFKETHGVGLGFMKISNVRSSGTPETFSSA